VNDLFAMRDCSTFAECETARGMRAMNYFVVAADVVVAVERNVFASA